MSSLSNCIYSFCRGIFCAYESVLLSYQSVTASSRGLLPILKDLLHSNPHTTRWQDFFSPPRMLCVYPSYCLGFTHRNMQWSRWFRSWDTGRKVAVSTPVGVTEIFHLRNPSGHKTVLGSTPPLTQMITWDIFCLSSNVQVLLYQCRWHCYEDIPLMVFVFKRKSKNMPRN